MSTETMHRTPTRTRRLRRSMVVMTLLLAAISVFGIANSADAAFSPWVNVQWRNFAAPAGDCTAHVGAQMRADKMAQGEAQVPCNLRHAHTGVSVRLVRWNGYNWIAQPWSDYNFSNSLGTGSRELLTQPSRICGNAAWYTEVWASVTTGTTMRTVRFANNYQYYDPCV